MASNSRTLRSRINRVYIEISNQCNLNCHFCAPTKRKPQLMTLDEFTSIIIQVKSITPYIYLHIKGEPTIHPLFDQFLTICDQHHMNVQLVTNATHLENIKPHHKSLRKLSLSLHSLDEHNYDLKNIEDHIDHLINNQDDYCTYLEARFWRKDDLKTRSQSILNHLLDTYHPIQCAHSQNLQINKRCFIGFEQAFDWPSLNNHTTSTAGTCKGGMNMIAIHSNGNVSACCLDNDGDISFGNIYTSQLMDILNGSLYQEFISKMSQHQLIHPLCQACTYRYRFNNKL